MKNQLLMICLCSMIACGDKDTIDSADTNPKETGEDSSVEMSTCVTPEFVDTQAFVWDDPKKYGGYAGTVTNTHLIVTDPGLGMIHGVPWVAVNGTIESKADFSLSVTTNGPDKATWSEGYVGVNDALAVNPDGIKSGALYIFKEETLDALSGDWVASDVADITIFGDTELGYAGALLAADVNSDSLLDAVVTIGPIPGYLAVFLDISSLSGDLNWDDADFTLDDICQKTDVNNVRFQSTNMKIFGTGSGDGLLAVGCPGEDYEGGEVLVFDLPLGNFSDPVSIVSNVSGWGMDAKGFEEPLYVDNRILSQFAVITDKGKMGLDVVNIEASSDAPVRWGASPTVTHITNDDGDVCKYVAVGDQGYVLKEEPTGGLYVSLLDSEGLPVEWVDVTIPSIEGDEDVKYIGVNNWFSPDGSYLGSTGWQLRFGVGGGMITTSLNY